MSLRQAFRVFLKAEKLGGKWPERIELIEEVHDTLDRPLVPFEVGPEYYRAHGPLEVYGEEDVGYLFKAAANLEKLPSRFEKQLSRWLFDPRCDPLIPLVRYIEILDVEGPEKLRSLVREPGFPTLSDLFSGILLTERDPRVQLLSGINLLRDVVGAGINPFGRMPVGSAPGDWAIWAEAKAENNRRVAEAVEKAQWGETASGLKLAWLETDFVGAPGALYGVGAQVVVAYSRHFGPARVPKFTVVGNGIRVDAALSELNAREPGWGGPPTGTIIGSPRGGSNLSLEEVVEIVRETL